MNVETRVPWTVALPTPEATEALGRRLGKLLFPGAVVALVGQLGAGKTFLVRAIAEGLGVPAGAAICSPTFVLIQEYEGRLPIYHFDTYRLRNVAEFADLGVHEYFAGKGVCLIEWADRVRQLLPREHLRIELQATGPTSRQAAFEAYGLGYQAVLEDLRRK